MNLKEIYAADMLSGMRNKLNYMPVTDSAVSNLFLVYILNDIILNKRRSIIEFGSGISTVYISKLIYEYNLSTEFISVDESGEWSKTVNDIIDKNRINYKPELITAPLKPCAYALGNLDWYDEKLLGTLLAGKSFDLLIIDGPSAWKQGFELARYPALPFLAKSMKSRCAVFLDDAGRDGEKKVLELWKEQSGAEFETVNEDFAFIQIGNHNNIKL
mgnify:CR=1 FL=1